jgi:lysophospholipase L1-like esterase
MPVNSVIRSWLVNSLLVLGMSVTTLGIAEYGLALLGFPDKIPLRVAHPPDYSETRKTGEFEYVFNTNDEGLRYRTLPLENTSGEFRVFVVGDSFTEGVGVNEGERFTDLLEQQSRQSDTPMLFINGGLAGTGPLEHGRMYFHVGRKYQPDALLITVYANDVTNTFAHLKKEWLYGETSSNDNETQKKALLEQYFPRLLSLLFMTSIKTSLPAERTLDNFAKALEKEARQRDIPQARIDAMIAALPAELVDDVNQGAFDGSVLGKAVTNPRYWADSLDIDTAMAEKKWHGVKSLLTETISKARSDGLQVAVLFIPTRYQYVPQSHFNSNPQVQAGMDIRQHWLTETSQLQKRLAILAGEMQLPFLDLTPMLHKANQQGLKLTYTADGHWNSLGHRLAADAISEWLTSKHVFEAPNTLATNKFHSYREKPSDNLRDDNYLQPGS